MVKVDGITPQRWLSRAHDKPRHGSCAIYFPGGISLGSFAKDVNRILVVLVVDESRNTPNQRLNCGLLMFKKQAA